MCVGSYGDGTASSGVVRIAKDLDESIENKEVLIVEDIIDSGKYTVLPDRCAEKEKSGKYAPVYAFG